jgi:hypothetical protein
LRTLAHPEQRAKPEIIDNRLSTTGARSRLRADPPEARCWVLIVRNSWN